MHNIPPMLGLEWIIKPTIKDDFTELMINKKLIKGLLKEMNKRYIFFTKLM